MWKQEVIKVFSHFNGKYSTIFYFTASITWTKVLNAGKLCNDFKSRQLTDKYFKFSKQSFFTSKNEPMWHFSAIVHSNNLTGTNFCRSCKKKWFLHLQHYLFPYRNFWKFPWQQSTLAPVCKTVSRDYVLRLRELIFMATFHNFSFIKINSYPAHTTWNFHSTKM